MARCRRGDVFESETILGPSGEAEDHVLIETIHLREKGELPEGCLLFHRGFVRTFLDLVSGDLVVLGHNSVVPIQRFGTLDEWYSETLRREYAARYDRT